MLRTRHLLPLLILLVSACFQPLFAGQNTYPAERVELPIVLASVYEHWEKDLQPFSAPSKLSDNTVLLSRSKSEELGPYFLLSILLIAVGVIVVGDASRFKDSTLVRDRASTEKEPLHS